MGRASPDDDMVNHGTAASMEFEAPSRGLSGFRGGPYGNKARLLNTLASLKRMGEMKDAAAARWSRIAWALDHLGALQLPERGFSSSGPTHFYEGRIVGEKRVPSSGVNAIKEKKRTNMRASVDEAMQLCRSMTALVRSV